MSSSIHRSLEPKAASLFQQIATLQAQLAAQAAVVEYLRRMGRQALDSIHDRNCAGAEIILRNDLADKRARLDAADVPQKERGGREERTDRHV